MDGQGGSDPQTTQGKVVWPKLLCLLVALSSTLAKDVQGALKMFSDSIAQAIRKYMQCFVLYINYVAIKVLSDNSVRCGDPSAGFQWQAYLGRAYSVLPVVIPAAFARVSGPEPCLIKATTLFSAQMQEVG